MSSSSPIIDGTNIDTSVFAYTSIKANPAGGKVVNLINKYFKESLTISTPLILTWGAQEGQDQAKKPTGKFSMSLQFPTSDYPNEDCEAFLNSIRNLEAQIKSDAITYSKEWFGKEIKSSEVMDEKFNVMLRYPKLEKGGNEFDYTKSPTLTIKIPCWKNIWQSEIYDEDNEPLFLKGHSHKSSPLEFLKPKTYVMCLIQCGGLWFVNGKVSITWNLKQAMVQKQKSPTITEGICYLKPKASDIEQFKSLPSPEENVEHTINSTIVEDSDEENELPLPIPAAEPVSVVVSSDEIVSAVVSAEDAKKKRVVKKKPTI
jgi:hypothetical protein